jgi:hypothetical protein
MQDHIIETICTIKHKVTGHYWDEEAADNGGGWNTEDHATRYPEVDLATAVLRQLERDHAVMEGMLDVEMTTVTRRLLVLSCQPKIKRRYVVYQCFGGSSHLRYVVEELRTVLTNDIGEAKLFTDKAVATAVADELMVRHPMFNVKYIVAEVKIEVCPGR